MVLTDFQPVVSVALDLIGFAIAEIIQTSPADAEDARTESTQKITKVVGNNGKIKSSKQTVGRGDVSDLVVFLVWPSGRQPAQMAPSLSSQSQ